MERKELNQKILQTILKNDDAKKVRNHALIADLAADLTVAMKTYFERHEVSFNREILNVGEIRVTVDGFSYKINVSIDGE